MSGFFEPVSLGANCSTKFQLSRELYLRRYPDMTTDTLRDALYTHTGSKGFNRHVFDWQITPTDAVIAYLERDFQGVYAREDLGVSADNEVVNRRFGTHHPHDFSATDGVLTEASIDDGFAAAKGKFEALAERFRTLSRRPGPYLYVHAAAPSQDQARRLLTALIAWAPKQSFRLLVVDQTGGSAEDLSGLDPRLDWAPIAPPTLKPPAQRWEGDDAPWARALQPYALDIHGGARFTRELEDVPSVWGPAAIRRRRFSWRRLFGHGQTP